MQNHRVLATVILVANEDDGAELTTSHQLLKIWSQVEQAKQKPTASNEDLNGKPTEYLWLNLLSSLQAKCRRTGKSVRFF